MITALVQFTLPQAVSLAQARTLFAGSAPNYLGLDGLVRKYYLLSADGRTAGGVYLWRSRETAERFYNEAWERFIEEKYGVRPTVTWFQSPVIVDNLRGEILDQE
jgi:hypothetical protein